MPSNLPARESCDCESRRMIEKYCQALPPVRALFRFEVCDTGDGIPLDAQRQIFEPFQQGSAGRKWGGTGLGPAISRRMVELMGGSLLVNSAPGEGSRFFFSVALAPASGETVKPGRGEVLSLATGKP